MTDDIWVDKDSQQIAELSIPKKEGEGARNFGPVRAVTTHCYCLRKPVLECSGLQSHPQYEHAMLPYKYLCCAHTDAQILSSQRQAPNIQPHPNHLTYRLHRTF